MSKFTSTPAPKAGTVVAVMNNTADLTFDAKGNSHLVVRPGFLPLKSIN